jgi:hypothetical protein
MNWLFHYQIWLGALIGLTMLRRFLIILAAEQGRKQDLVKKLYKHTHEFRLSVMIPFLNENDYPALLALLKAIHEQSYPASKVTIHLVTAGESGRVLVPQSLRQNVRVWEYPSERPSYDLAMSWLIDRCLARGGNSLFVFLRPTDIVKPDFFRNIVARSLDSFVIQGYIALKNSPETFFSKAAALSGRLFNRIDNAGRFHMGMSCRLLDSGWAIKQDVLEMIPYHRGLDLDNLEYTLRLNLENFRVTWAPNVVVYADAEVDFLERVVVGTGSVFNRLRLLLSYGPRLLTGMLLRFDAHSLASLAAIFRPPTMLLSILGVAMAVLTLSVPALASEKPFWLTVVIGSLILNLLALSVGRCRTVDFVTLLIHTPLAYLCTLLASPIGLLVAFRRYWSERGSRARTYRRMRKTRFNEELAPPPTLFDETQESRIVQELLMEQNTDLPPLLDTGSSTDLALTGPREREIVRPLPLSNGVKQVQCLLRTRISYNTAGQECYQLTLEYKNIAFSTATYRILDQAFYELHAKLVGRGLIPIACGSCCYFYNPTADQPGALKSTGVCLQGKMGREVDLNADAVSVISPACSHHGPLEQREAVVRQWRESLALSHSLPGGTA